MKTFRFIFSLFAATAGLSLSPVFGDEQDAPPPAGAPAIAHDGVNIPEVESAATSSGSASKIPEAFSRAGRRSENDRVIFRWGGEALLPAGEKAEHVVSLFGSTRVEGRARENVVAVFGPVLLENEGEAGGNVVAVLGPVRVNGPVSGNVVSVLGRVELGPDAWIDGDVVSVGGSIRSDPGAVAKNGVIEVGAFEGIGELKGLHAWVRHAFLLGRPLAWRADVAWAWCVAGAFLALYLLIAVVANRPLILCAETLEQRPGKTVLAAFLSVLFTPLLLVVLSITVIGVPLLLLAIAIVSLIGKAAFLCWFGRRITLALGLRHSAPAVLVGGLLLLALYLVPFVGFTMMKISDLIGVGMVVYTVMLANRKGKMVTANAPAGPAGVRTSGTTSMATSAQAHASMTSPPPVPSPVSVVPVMAPVEAAASADEAKNMSGNFTPPPPPVASQFQEQRQSSTPIGETTAGSAGVRGPITAALPRAGFGIRLAALVLDFILIGAIASRFHPADRAVPLLAVYLIVFWALKGTTIGGIICGLKIVRLDDRRLDWTTAIVRGLAGFLSILPFGLGFLWIVFDDEKQSWHDKVAGTVVVHAPKGTSLV